MKQDALFINKISAAVLTAGLLAMVSGILAESLYHVELPDGVEGQAFVIAEPTTGTEVAAAAEPAEPAGPGDILPMLASADIADGEKVAKKCVACHNFEEGAGSKVGPDLYDVVMRKKASVDFSYSAAFQALDGEWDYDALNHFLYAPTDYAPGTKMSFRGVRKDEDRANLIAYLRTLSTNPAPLP
jgi:cytochrome c